MAEKPKIFKYLLTHAVNFATPILLEKSRSRAILRRWTSQLLVLLIFRCKPTVEIFQYLITRNKQISWDRCHHLLRKHRMPSKIGLKLIYSLLNEGFLNLAKPVASYLLSKKDDKFLKINRLEIQRATAILYFLSGDNKQANHHFKLTGEHRRTLFKPNTPTKYRILGSSWYAALGHIAMLDFYLKYKRLNGQNDHRIVAAYNPSSLKNFGCASDLMSKLSALGINVITREDLERDYNEWAKENKASPWHQLSKLEKQALVDDFWEFEFPDGTILGFAHALARIQQGWESAGFAPLFTITPSEKELLNTFLSGLGLPQNAWFVCLHVRESGYHKNWNTTYPSMRDSEIKDYYPAIKEITDAGGWVLRMGDPSMKKLKRMRNVIDYAHHPKRSSQIDMLLAASCRFLLGTNSGFATIPAIYGVPCALSNWVPIGWPMWQSKDLIISKLFREKSTKKFLTLEQIFERGLAFLQNWSDLPDDIELVANTPEDIRKLTLEMLNSAPREKKSAFHEKYLNIAKQHETFAIAQFANSFVSSYPEVFTT